MPDHDVIVVRTDAGEFVACDVPAVADLLLRSPTGTASALSCKIRGVTADQVWAQIWAAVGSELGITRPFPAVNSADANTTCIRRPDKRP